MIWTIFWRNPSKLSPRQLAAIDETSESSAIKRLSVRPFLLWLERFFISRESFWFDQNYIYVFRGQEFVAKYKFEQIAALEGTKTRINSARIWRICFAEEFEQDGSTEYKFAPAISIFTLNFKEFLQILHEKDEDTIKTKPRFWEEVWR